MFNIGATDFPEEAMGNYTFAKEDIVLLGITITMNENESIDKNFATRLKAMKNILKQWSRRKLSLKGKITVINALALSLVVYPASVLITPLNVLEDINKILYEFLWDGKRPKIAAKIMESNIKLGGLKMPNIFLKVKAWQLSWLQRALRKPDSNWVLIVNELIPNMKLTDLLHCKLDPNHNVINSLPIFYKDIVCTWFKLKSSFSPEEMDHNIINKSLWLNKDITIDGNEIFWLDWYKHGIIFIKDILTENGIFMTGEQLYEKYGVNTNFLSVLQIRQSLRYDWRQKIMNLNVILPSNPELMLKFTTKNTPFTKFKTFSFYQMLNKLEQDRNGIQPKCILKWNNTFNNELHFWEEIFSRPFAVGRCTKLQSFQFRMLHRIITCNHWLFNVGIKNSPNCETCNADDTLIHFFIDCVHVQNFWESFKIWWANATSVPVVNLSKQNLLLGIKKTEKHFSTLNFIIFLANKFIHDSKMTVKQDVSFPAFLITLKLQLHFEKQICIKNNQLIMFNVKWNWLCEQQL